jgi:hypothetical protein
VPCHETRRFEDLSSTHMRPHRVCPQQRLYSVWAYCDDPIFIVVGAERTLRAATVAPTQPPTTAAITNRPSRGTRVFVQRHLWPTYACEEHAGEGWAATVVSTTAHTCVVSFDFACAPDGSAFESERLATEALLLLL